jgi:hypothetical protein
MKNIGLQKIKIDKISSVPNYLDSLPEVGKFLSFSLDY